MEAPFKIVLHETVLLILMGHTFVTQQQKSNKLKNSPFLNHPCCCCHEWESLPVAGTDLVFCFACSEHNPYFHFLYLSCSEYTRYFHFLSYAVSKYFVFSGNFRCASLTLVRLVTPVHCLQLASIVIDISLPRLHNTQGPGKSQLRAGRRTRSVRVFRVTVSDKLRLTERIFHLPSLVWRLLVCPSSTWATAYWSSCPPPPWWPVPRPPPSPTGDRRCRYRGRRVHLCRRPGGPRFNPSGFFYCQEDNMTNNEHNPYWDAPSQIPQPNHFHLLPIASGLGSFTWVWDTPEVVLVAIICPFPCFLP